LPSWRFAAVRDTALGPSDPKWLDNRRIQITKHVPAGEPEVFNQSKVISRWHGKSSRNEYCKSSQSLRSADSQQPAFRVQNQFLPTSIAALFREVV